MKIGQPLRLLLLAALLLPGCAPKLMRQEAKQVRMRTGAYRALVHRAYTGDAGAAEDLAQLWYLNSEDNRHAIYWLNIAKGNGSRRADQMMRLAGSRLPE